METLAFIKEISIAVSSIVVAGTAIYGIKQWKIQLKGRTNYDIARRYLRATLKVRDALKSVRNPLITQGEMESALKEHGFDSSEYKDLDKTNRAVYSIRWNKVQEALSDLETIKLEAEALWGPEIEKASQPLVDTVRELSIAIIMHFQGGRVENLNDEIIYDAGDKNNPDEYSQKVNSNIDTIRDFLKPYLK